MAGNHSQDWHRVNDRANELDREANRAQDRGDKNLAASNRSEADRMRRGNPHS